MQEVKVGRDLMLGGTTLYRVDAQEAKKLDIRVLMPLYLELPSGLIQVVPYLEVSRKVVRKDVMFNLPSKDDGVPFPLSLQK